MIGGGDGWNDIIQLDTGNYACRWHFHGDITLVGCDHPTEDEALTHCYTAARAREAIQPHRPDKEPDEPSRN